MKPTFMSLHASADSGYAGSALAQSRAALILLHGRGANPESILSLSRLFPAQKVHSVAPAAPGGVWYPQRFLAPLALNQPWLDQALESVNAEVQKALAAGIPQERIAVLGFSQGACLALEYVARNPGRYLFVAGLSGALIGPPDLVRATAALHGTPVLLSCAEADAHIPLPHVETSLRWFEASGAQVTAQIQPGTQHGVFPSAVAWLQEQAAKMAAL